ncbi:MAG TPA: hypothetical protein VE954_29540 [Oligoflexus sp.]|uniref:hypothetical protein n=1 Tax=Oligoflexus sp. TaxID=1971216 RepID=UPI002D24A012|nr:hypothetical protein [Oligoflexus sp.]HYX37268.1 hypothetical protein [Oligoflexus sp.]
MTEELIRELETLFRDYDVSPRGKGRRFPAPVKGRMITLLQSGTSPWELSRATGISLTTLCSWKDRNTNASFEKIEVRPSKAATARIYIGENAWIEMDMEAISSALLQKIRASL